MYRYLKSIWPSPSPADYARLHGFPPARTARLLVIVEGRHDIEFLYRINTILHDDDRSIPDLCALQQCGQLLFIPAGGGDFRPWLSQLSTLGCAEFHLYDREVPPVSVQRESWAETINARSGCRAYLTRFRALENYLHPAAIRDARGLSICFGDFDDVASVAAQASYLAGDPDTCWDHLTARGRRRLRDRAKLWLNTVAVECMTIDRLADRDPQEDVRAWFRTIENLL